MKPEIKVIHDANSTVVILTSNRRFPELIDKIEGNLKKNYNGVIFIDLLLTNGLNNRFIEIPVNHGSLVMSNARPMASIENKLLNKINKYFLTHKESILDSYISRVEKNRILRFISH